MRRIIYKYLSGFTFGVMMLVLCFLLTYTFGGQGYYQSELVQILDPGALLIQAIWAGILYVCISITITNTHEFLKVDNNDVTVQYLLLLVIHILIIVFVSFLAQEYGNFGVGVYSVLFGFGMIILMLGTLADMVQNIMKLKKLHKKIFVIRAEPKQKVLEEKTTTSKTAKKTSSTTKTASKTSKPKTTSSKTTKK